ncbi:uncharacterized protein PHALS_10753 [Plasmopara halstedii]|uniref:Uncharacterized protein n=1 Tax=Plasmopara halstedii TaxID=4781 RepID=A0A0P1AH56_PLAHL|nr:uncharacterized protein PHALS_10753 [Plasmopara halstedii]CEG40564.1 hypothetical protein PHALS_10753 [Plasmopara halstedii]|eukprot:XP_024576933.1 hypothetical protein PHALS_10753 [Plasmopara halstedii]
MLNIAEPPELSHAHGLAERLIFSDCRDELNGRSRVARVIGAQFSFEYHHNADNSIFDMRGVTFCSSINHFCIACAP